MVGMVEGDTCLPKTLATEKCFSDVSLHDESLVGFRLIVWGVFGPCVIKEFR